MSDTLGSLTDITGSLQGIPGSSSDILGSLLVTFEAPFQLCSAARHFRIFNLLVRTHFIMKTVWCIYTLDS